LADEAQSDTSRLTAAQQAVEMAPGDDKIVSQLLAAVNPRSSPALATGILDALGASQAPGLGNIVVQKLPSLTPSARRAALRVLMNRPESTRALLDGLDKGQVQLTELSLEQKQALADHPNQQIAKRARALLERGGGLPNADRQEVIDQLMPLTTKTGDAAGGKLVFKKHCVVCHTHSGEGNKIGPDLTGMAAHPKHELLVHIFDPSRSVEGNYRLYQVVTEDGKVMNGLLASETKTSLEIYDVEGKKHVLQRDNVSQLIATPKSLMPDGFEKQLKEPEIVDLLEFLTARGQFLPLALNKVATAVSTRGMFYSEDAPAERLIFKDWGMKTFEGVPFQFVDPQGDRVPNAILFYGPQGKLPPKMPKSVTLPCNAPAKAIHFLSGVSGWGYPYSEKGSVSLIVRLHYADGKTEDHPLKNGEHFADYIRRVDVPGSKFAFALRGQQLRYFAVTPERRDVIERIELVKGPDPTAPIVMAVTVETR
jgi:putative heme-binding domain-containing protein